MKNRGSQGGPVMESEEELERLDKVIVQGFEAIQNAVRQGTLKYANSSVIFICGLPWEKALEVACWLMGPEAVENAVKNNGGSREQTTITLVCPRHAADEILSTKLNDVSLAKTFDDRKLESKNLVPVIIPTDSVLVITYYPIPRR
jgi:hypothetical protein